MRAATASAKLRGQRGWRWRSATALLIGVVALASPRSARGSDNDAAAIRTLVEAGKYASRHVRRLSALTDALRHLYNQRAYAALWFRDGRLSPQAQTVVDTIAAAKDEGLNPADYDAPRIAVEAEQLRAAAAVGAAEMAAFDVGLTASTMRYVTDTFHGAIDPERAGLKLELKATPLHLEQVVTDTASGDAMAALRALAPPFPAYRYLKDALQHTRIRAALPAYPVAPALPTLHPGEVHAELPALRRFLAAVGDLPADAPGPADPTIYDEELAKAVAHFQHRHGLDEDGIIGAGTSRQLRTPVSHRVVQLRLALERLRWLPREFPQRIIVVNLPEFRLRAYDGDPTHAVLTMNVVVGSVAQKTETPLLSADMRYVIFRPHWNVPDSITQKEMLPSIRRNPAYFHKQNLELIGAGGEVLEPTDENIGLLAGREARLRQKPGTKNSLGLIKFVLPNRHDIYFHDTPSKGLFQRARRDFSHGCIRVADPVALAELALTGVAGWTRDRIEHAMQNDDPNKMPLLVNLATPIAVYLVYTTATAAEDGQIIFLDDIYGHDARLGPLLTGQ